MNRGTITKICYWSSNSCPACEDITPLFDAVRKYNNKQLSLLKYELESLGFEYFADNDIQSMPTLTIDVNGARTQKITDPEAIEKFLKDGIMQYVDQTTNTYTPAPSGESGDDPYSAPVVSGLLKWGVGAFIVWKLWQSNKK